MAWQACHRGFPPCGGSAWARDVSKRDDTFNHVMTIEFDARTLATHSKPAISGRAIASYQTGGSGA